MSSEELKPPTGERTIDKVNNDYGLLAAKFGDAIYRIVIQALDVKNMFFGMKELNQEGFALQQKAKEEPPKVVEAEVVPA